jgi:hypothetical protein
MDRRISFERLVHIGLQRRLDGVELERGLRRALLGVDPSGSDQNKAYNPER